METFDDYDAMVLRVHVCSTVFSWIYENETLS